MNGVPGFMKEKLKNIFIPVFTLVSFAIYSYGSYALFYEFPYWPENMSSVLYIALMTVAFAFFGYLFVSSLKWERLAKKTLIAGCFGGGFLFNLIFWLTNIIVERNENVIIYSYSILFPLIAVIIFTAYIKRSKYVQKILSIVLAVVFALSAFAGGFITNKDRIVGAQYTKNITFDSITADEMKVSDEEKERCREWYNANVVLKTGIGDMPYNFEYGGLSFRDNIDDWDLTRTAESKTGAYYQGGKTTFLLFDNEECGLQATVEATIYEENATCEWTLYIRNYSDENSEVITNYYALDYSFETGDSCVYYSKGSTCEANDFALGMKNLSAITKEFGCEEGRSSYIYMPYFNISGEESGFVLGIGWSGEWLSEMSNEDALTNVSVKQAEFEAYLLPEEEVRSPLVSMTFYDYDNALKGFNMFRNWISACVYPDNIPDTMTVLEVAGPESTNTADQIFETLDTFSDELYSEIDSFWMDAGWYENVNGWYDSVGNWTADKSRYDNGIIEISDYAQNKDCGLVLWYEPERVYADTHLGKIGAENEKWLVYKDDGEFAMWNLAETDAAEYLAQYVSSSLVENGVSVYRQDFNYDISMMWKTADKEFYDGRKGVCENHYVINLYRYLDYLASAVDNLIIDNCASGGRRLDLEMTRRSVPMWRSDYNCSMHDDIHEATQAQTYGLSFWLPKSGTIVYSDTEYSARSSIMFGNLETFGTVNSEFFGAYKEQRELMNYNFYPITSGGYDTNKILSMQYSDADGLNGEAFVYKRADVKDSSYTLKLNGLLEDSVYVVYDIDTPEKKAELTGRELMKNGYDISLPEGEKAVIIMFSAVKN